MFETVAFGQARGHIEPSLEGCQVLPNKCIYKTCSLKHNGQNEQANQRTPSPSHPLFSRRQQHQSNREADGGSEEHNYEDAYPGS